MKKAKWPDYEELDICATPIGELLLRRRRPLTMPDTWVYEVKLDERFLMSSLVHASEDALARLALSKLEGENWRVLVGGLGLGHTAAAAMAWDKVDSIDIVEFLPEVIRWHQNGLVPLAAAIAGDPRCHTIEADCFEWIRKGRGGNYDAVLIDIDDSPEHLLSPSHGSFYAEAGLADARRALKPGGVFALWTAGEVLPAFLERLRRVFGEAEVAEVEFHNPLHHRDDLNTIYIAKG
ncbi:MAG: spermidine synthase [Planctomycetota bacterium]|jgi:spermidine synthase